MPSEATESSLRCPYCWMRAISQITPSPSCNCVQFATNYPRQFWLSTYEGEIGHVVVRLKDEGDSWIIIESNYIPCEISFRRIYKDDPIIKKIYGKP